MFPRLSSLCTLLSFPRSDASSSLSLSLSFLSQPISSPPIIYLKIVVWWATTLQNCVLHLTSSVSLSFLPPYFRLDPQIPRSVSVWQWIPCTIFFGVYGIALLLVYFLGFPCARSLFSLNTPLSCLPGFLSPLLLTLCNILFGSQRDFQKLFCIHVSFSFFPQVNSFKASGTLDFHRLSGTMVGVPW